MLLISPWTPAKVEERLVRAYRLMPGRPVMSTSSGFTCDGHEVEPFSWPGRFVPDLWSRRVLMTWARCIATGESVRQRFNDLYWPRAKAERRRRVALTLIAQGLNREAATLLDNETKREVVFRQDQRGHTRAEHPDTTYQSPRPLRKNTA